ncbi:hypothetical protein [Streptomyces sp. SYSU K217416]
MRTLTQGAEAEALLSHSTAYFTLRALLWAGALIAVFAHWRSPEADGKDRRSRGIIAAGTKGEVAPPGEAGPRHPNAAS